MRQYRESSLQVLINKFVRTHVPQPHFFCAIDSAKKSSSLARVREKARGVVSGTPDTLLIVPGLPAILIELKAKGRKVEEGSAQEHVGAKIEAAGGHWAWCDTVLGYAAILLNLEVPLAGRWDLTAATYDALLESAAIRREEAGGTVSKRRYQAPKPTAARIRAVGAVRERAAAKGVLV